MGGRRWLTVILGAAIAGQAIALCSATGGRAFTRFPSPEIERLNRPSGLELLFAPSGLNDRLGEMDHVENTFSFGWLPYPTLRREALSVVTVGGPGAALVLIGLWPSRTGRPPRESGER